MSVIQNTVFPRLAAGAVCCEYRQAAGTVAKAVIMLKPIGRSARSLRRRSRQWPRSQPQAAAGVTRRSRKQRAALSAALPDFCLSGRIADYCCKDTVIPLRLREASRPIAGPFTFKTTPFVFCSSATLPPPTTASAAEPCVYAPAMSAAVRRFSAVPTNSTADAPMVPTLMPPMLSR